MLIGLFRNMDICYNSLNYFMEGIEEALHNHGIQTQWVDAVNSEVLKKKWDAFVGINSSWSSVKLKNGVHIMDLIDCPMFEILVDAPYYVHHGLRDHMQNLHLIVLDEGYVEYCKKHYTSLKSVSMACLLGPVTEYKEYTDREIDVLFTASLYDIDKQKQKIKLDYSGKWQEKFFEDVLELSIANPNASMEEVMDSLISAYEIDCDADMYGQMMNYFGMGAEYYLRGYYREKVIRELVDSGLNVCVAGGGWERLYSECPSNLVIKESVEFSKVAELTANAKIALNVMPWFKRGMHDRILSNMMNGAVCVTDGSSYINSHFADNEELIIYNLEKISELPNRIKELLDNEKKARSIACKGREKALKNYSWNKIVEENILKTIRLNEE